MIAWLDELEMDHSLTGVTVTLLGNIKPGIRQVSREEASEVAAENSIKV